MNIDHFPTQRMGYDLMSPEQTQASVKREERHKKRQQAAATAPPSVARELEDEFAIIPAVDTEPVSCSTQTDIWLTATKIYTTTGSQTSETFWTMEDA